MNGWKTKRNQIAYVYACVHGTAREEYEITLRIIFDQSSNGFFDLKWRCHKAWFGLRLSKGAARI